VRMAKCTTPTSGMMTNVEIIEDLLTDTNRDFYVHEATDPT